MRHIGPYDYEGLCRVFIDTPNKSASTAGYRMSFNGDKIYSYRSLLAVIDRKTNTLLIDIHIAKYSNTTSKQVNKLTQAHQGTIYHVDLDSALKTVTGMWKACLQCITKMKKARTETEFYRKCAVNMYKKTIQYMDYIKIDKRTSAYRQKNKVLLELMRSGAIQPN